MSVYLVSDARRRAAWVRAWWLACKWLGARGHVPEIRNLCDDVEALCKRIEELERRSS